MFTEIIAKILLIDESDITDDLKRVDLESWDSMTHLILISDLEQEFNVTFSDDEIASIESIQNIKDILKKHNVAI